MRVTLVEVKYYTAINIAFLLFWILKGVIRGELLSDDEFTDTTRKKTG